MNIVFFGTSEFGISALKKLTGTDFKILIITQPDQPAGRKQIPQPSPIKLFAQKNQLGFLQPKKLIPIKSKLLNFQPALGIVAAYGKIIPQEIIKIFPNGILNIHPSLLPNWRGPSPIQFAILNQEKITGVSIILLDEKMDHGPILTQKEIEIKDDDNNVTLGQKLAKLGAELLITTIPQYLAGQIKPQPQNEALATYTQIIKRQDGQISWQNSAWQIFAQFRAFYPWPGIYAYWGSKRLKIANLGVLEGDLDQNLPAGTIFLGKKGEFLVKCGQGAIKIEKIQLEGKKGLVAEEFLLGYKNIIGATLK